MKFDKKILSIGQNLVEFAIIFPILILIIIFIFDLGRAVILYSVLSNASREGARFGIIYAAQNPEENEGQVYTALSSRVCERAIGLDIDCPNPSMTVSLVDFDGNGRDDELQVKLTYGFSPVTPLIGAFLNLDENNQLILTSQSNMRIEN